MDCDNFTFVYDSGWWICGMNVSLLELLKAQDGGMNTHLTRKERLIHRHTSMRLRLLSLESKINTY